MIKTKVFYAVQCDRCGHVDEDHWMPDIESLEFDDWSVKGKKHYCPDCHFTGEVMPIIPEQVLRIKEFLKTFVSSNKDAIITETSDGIFVECYLATEYLTEAQIAYIKELSAPYTAIVHINPSCRRLDVEVVI